MTPISVPAFAHPRVRQWNALSVRWQVRAVARLTGMGRPDVIITLPTAWDVARQLPARTRVVNRADRFSSLPEADTELIADMERQMLEACDVAVYVSPELMADERLWSRRRAVGWSCSVMGWTWSTSPRVDSRPNRRTSRPSRTPGWASSAGSTTTSSTST